MKREQSVLVNGIFKKPSTKLKKGDLIEVKIEEDMANFESQNLNLDIIYDDFDIIMVNKPPFMVVHPTKSHFDNTIANGVTYYINEKSEKVKIRFVNRLDMNTSGLVIVAKNAYAHHTLSLDMSNDNVEKKYITVVKGIVKDDEGTIDEPIYRPTEDSIKRVVDERGQASVTHYKVLERLDDATVLEVKLETGRTHQIRVHLSYIKYPIIGDQVYGRKSHFYTSLGQMLHAYKLSFIHPISKERVTFTSEVDDEFNRVQKILENE